MRFEKMKVKSDSVELTREQSGEKGAHDNIITVGENPARTLIDAFQAFVSYAVSVIPVFAPISDDLEVTTLSFGEEKDGRRTLQVSFNLVLEKLNGKVVSLTTPRVSEPGETSEGGSFVLTKEVLAMIKAVEIEGERFIAGVRDDLFAQPSANADAAAERMSAESAGATRKRGRSGRQGEVVANIGASHPVQ